MLRRLQSSNEKTLPYELRTTERAIMRLQNMSRRRSGPDDRQVARRGHTL